MFKQFGLYLQEIIRKYQKDTNVFSCQFFALACH